jgi:DNA-binding NarL/FixJ family response regulator
MCQRTNVLARIRDACEAAPDAKVMLLSGRMDGPWFDDAFAAGADAVIARTLRPAALGLLLEQVADGNVVHAPREVRAPRAASRDHSLTVRELEVLRLVCEGRTNGRVAEELSVSEQTVKFHLCNVYRKLGVGNRTEATRHAHLHALVDQPPAARTSA